MVFHIYGVWRTVWQHVDVFTKLSDMKKGAYKSTKWMCAWENGPFQCLVYVSYPIVSYRVECMWKLYGSKKKIAIEIALHSLSFQKWIKTTVHWLAFSFCFCSWSLGRSLMPVAVDAVVVIHISNWNSGAWMRFPIVHHFRTMVNSDCMAIGRKWAQTRVTN